MSDNEKQFLFRLDERVDGIGERISVLEGKLEKEKAKGVKKHFSEYGGILALIFSIVIGAFTIYDKVILQPRKEAAFRLDTFRKDINSLVQLSSQISSLDWDRNPASAQAQAQSLTPQKIALIESIERYGEVHPDKLKFADRLMLANENELFSWYGKALIHANKALEVSTDSMQTANAYWAIARMNGKMNKLSEMRSYYEKAINEFEVIGLNSSAGSVMQLYTQWIYAELVQNGSCEPAEKVFDAMKTVYSKAEVWPSTKVGTQREFQKAILQAPKTCGLKL